MIIDDILTVLVHEGKVESNLSPHFPSVQEQYDLWLDSTIEEYLHFWGGIAVNFYMLEFSIISAEIIVIFINLVADRIPRGMEIQASV